MDAVESRKALPQRRREGISWRDVFGTMLACARLPGAQRASTGLTWRKLLVDLPEARRIAAELRRPLTYARWVECHDMLTDRDRALIARHIESFGARPRFRLLVVSHGGWAPVQASLDSLRGQLYRNLSVAVLDTTGRLSRDLPQGAESTLAAAGVHLVARHRLSAWLWELDAQLAGQGGRDWVALLRAGDRLAEHALYWLAWEALVRPEAALIYCDDDEMDVHGARERPRFKPDWSPEHLRSTHYIGPAAFLRGRAVAAAGGIGLEGCLHGNYDLVLRVADGAGFTAAHVPAVLYHRGGTLEADESEASRRALRAHLGRHGLAAAVVSTLPGCQRVRYRLPEAAPMVSVIMPVRDESTSVRTSVRRCIAALTRTSTYPNYELIVIDCGSTDPDTAAFLTAIAHRPRIRVLSYERPFNQPAIANFAACRARGEVLCLMDDDTEVVSPDWMEEMLSRLLLSGVGVVGARLRFTQNAAPRPAAEREEPGYCARALLAQELSAVSGACLMTWKHLYVSLGGLDEARLEAAFSDVDYCLRVQRAGHRVIYTPYAELYRHAPGPRGQDHSVLRRWRARRAAQTMRSRWGWRMGHDPYYNPNLDCRHADFSLGDGPRVERPWLQMR